MTDPTDRNRLSEEASPYLRQHADNPVHWQPWDSAALEAARERDVPIFLSIGYSACHWCHVMEEESFADEELAAVLNENFVPVKVDREERPDLDSIYMTVCQLVTGRGGWPLSAWLTPEGKPFYVGTYFPPEPMRGTPGFRDLLERIAESWQNPEDRREMENRADQWTDAAVDQLEETPDQPGDAPDESALDDAVQAAIRSADREFGGFGQGGPKFPQPGRIDLLLRAYNDSGREPALAVAGEALDAMARGGLYDHVGGGFHRYATDRQWTVPHFEKMLYDNAELSSVYLSAYRLTGEPRYARVAVETFAFVERELTHPDGGLFSTLDARSGDEEGSFYVWTPEQVAEVLDEPDASLFCDRYGVTSGGNFEGGRTVLTVSTSVAELASEHGLDESEVRERLMDARAALFDARERRTRPARDEKVLAGWNGLMISAFAKGARTVEPSLVGNARDALSFVREHLWDEDEERLSRRFIAVSEDSPKGDETESRGDVKGDGYLEDYAFLSRGAFDLYQATGDVDALAFALELGRAMVEEFWDAEAETLYFTPESGDPLVARPQEFHDQSTPSSLGVAASLLLDLEHFSPNDDFGDIAERVVRRHADRVRGSPLEHVSLALAAAKLRRGSLELTIAAETLPDDWRGVLAGRYLPDAVVSIRPPDESELEGWLDRLGLEEVPPIWAGREAVDARPTVYACESFTCSPPKHDIRAALDWAVGGD